MRGTKIQAKVRPVLGALALVSALSLSACGSTNDEEAGAAGLADGAAASGGSSFTASAPTAAAGAASGSGRRPLSSSEVPSAGYGDGTGTGGTIKVGVSTGEVSSPAGSRKSSAGASKKSAAKARPKKAKGGSKPAKGESGTSAGAPAATDEVPTSAEAARLAKISLEDLFPRLRRGDGTVCTDLYTQARVEKMTGRTGQEAIDECARRIEENPAELYLEKIEDTNASNPREVSFRAVVRFQVYRKTLIMYFVRERGAYKHDRSETAQQGGGGAR